MLLHIAKLMEQGYELTAGAGGLRRIARRLRELQAEVGRLRARERDLLAEILLAELVVYEGEIPKETR